MAPGKPAVIRMGKSETRFSYDESGRLIRKVDRDGGVVELTYAEGVGKIGQVRRYQLENPAKVKETLFRYDARNQLILVSNSAGEKVALTYDGSGKIVSLTGEGGEKLLFTYNANGKLATIAVVGGEEIQVTYNEKGGIEKIDGNGDSRFALSVSRQMQHLQDIVKAADVDLEF